MLENGSRTLPICNPAVVFIAFPVFCFQIYKDNYEDSSINHTCATWLFNVTVLYQHWSKIPDIGNTTPGVNRKQQIFHRPACIPHTIELVTAQFWNCSPSPQKLFCFHWRGIYILVVFVVVVFHCSGPGNIKKRLFGPSGMCKLKFTILIFCGSPFKIFQPK